MGEREFKGIPVSPGVAIGKVFLFDSEEDVIVKRKLSPKDIPNEITRFEGALIQARREILDIQKKIAKAMGTEHAEIFNAHLLVVEDRALIEEVIKNLEKQRYNVEYIFIQVAKKYSKIFSRMEDDYLKERASDIRDVARRVLHKLIGKKRQDLAVLKEEVIIAAYDLSPSDTALMHKEKVIGFVTDIGGKTSHTAIMARSLGIPAVVGLRDVSRKIKPDAMLIIDGNRGIVIVNPSKTTLERYAEQQTKFEIFEEKLASLKNLPAETKDGFKITLAANIELPEDVPSVIAHGAQGVGLYRTEFLYMNRSDLPKEEEQFQSYKQVAEKVSPHTVIIRTMDLGGDKFLSHLQIPREMNPFLGWRAIRFCLARLDIFKVQLRAILRASAFGKIKMMYPMISGVNELKDANAAVEEAKKELRKEKKAFDENLEIGAMIEIPSAAVISDILAEEVDFFSIGTNDLIQYSLAVDRVNERIAYLYEPTHPAVLRLIDTVVQASKKNDIWVGICGEMAGDPATVLLLLGLGLQEFSTSAVMVPEIKKVIRSVTLEQTKQLIRKVQKYRTAEEVLEEATKLLYKVAPELVAMGT
ncbi:MAG: phosphoenolpyruvate--protein phosphotransferase [Candidatus Ancaeobacter aquaticus]|nr:phosphoenolpyruvate--protein phosphotransferase [Candidatus Ancaeobacter aquaticus]